MTVIRYLAEYAGGAPNVGHNPSGIVMVSGTLVHELLAFPLTRLALDDRSITTLTLSEA